MESLKLKKIESKIHGLNLPNLYVVVDIFCISYKSILAAGMFRMLNKQCYNFYEANKTYLEQSVNRG